MKMTMRTNLMRVVSLTLLIALQPAVSQQSGPDHDVRAAVSAFSHAFVDADVALLEELLTKDYIHVNGSSGGVLTGDDWLQWVASRRDELRSGGLIVDTYSVHDLEVRIYGKTAVVAGIVLSSGSSKGVPFTSRLRFTNTWVRQEGRWRRAAFHDSKMPASP